LSRKKTKLVIFSVKKIRSHIKREKTEMLNFRYSVHSLVIQFSSANLCCNYALNARLISLQRASNLAGVFCKCKKETFTHVN